MSLEKQREKQRGVKSKRKKERHMKKKDRHTYRKTEINDTGNKDVMKT